MFRLPRGSLRRFTGLAIVAVFGLLAPPGLTTPAAAAGSVVSNFPVVGAAAHPKANGYWQVASDGGVFNFGDAKFHGSMGGQRLNAPVVGMAATPSGNGYWLAAADGGIFNFGDAKHHGSMGGQRLNAPVVGIAATPSGNGYWLTAADGGIFNFGDAKFSGSMGGQRLNAPVVGIAATPSGNGYWLTAADGGIFNFGDARFFGSMGGQRLNAGVVGIAATTSGSGYWLTAADGGIFNFGDAKFHGSMGGQRLAMPVSGIARTRSGAGYWLVARDGGLFSYGDAAFLGHAVYTGQSSTGPSATAAQLAQSLLASGSTFATAHPSGKKDSAYARQNLLDTAAGKPAARSCYGNAPCGTVPLKVTMLQALLQITNGRAVNVSEIAGASHSKTSLHYQGSAFDLDRVAGSGGAGNSIPRSKADPVIAICRAQGAKEYWLELADGAIAGATQPGNHVHCAWSATVA